ncbi:MAG: LacI family DNA-binding transcriptional regulator [Actinomycetaceae bacterium]|nr:LacI family DNA-binding transcriptional regulator [Actinomycetaceae bacterium]
MTEKKRATIREVAEVADVSIATVSRVLNKHETVDPRLAKRVRRAVEELGYIPNLSGRTLRGKNSRIFAAIVPNLMDPFYVDVISAFEQVVSEHGYHVLLCNSNEKRNQERTNLRVLKEQNLAGLLFAPVAELPGEVEEMYQSGSAIVLLDRPVADTSIPWVGTDYENVGRVVANFLRSKGVQKPLVASSRTMDSPLDERADAFWNSWNNAEDVRCEINVDYVAPPAMSTITDELNQCMASVDAVFCTNGPVTRIVYDALYRQLLNPAETLIFLGFDNSPWCSLVTPSPTLVEQKVENIGAQAALVLISQIEGEKEAEERKPIDSTTLQLEVSIKERQTTPA